MSTEDCIKYGILFSASYTKQEQQRGYQLSYL